MFRDATFKLTLWYMLIIVVISLAFSFVVYQLAMTELANGLAHQTERFSNELPAYSNNPFFHQTSELSSGRHQIITNLIVFNIVVFFTAGFASYALAKRTLAPIEITHEQQKRFTADVSHELRTPLTALKMEAEVALLDKTLSKKGIRDALESNLEEVAKLETLINNLMRLTRLETATLQQQFSKVDVHDVLDEALAATAKSIAAEKITVDTNVKSAFVRGDRGSLTQLFVVLIDNAIKYSPQGSKVTITSRLEGDDVIVAVKDVGQGIEPKALEHVFERFYRADRARQSGATQGFGLGLSIAKYIADMHAGTITLSSRLAHGTTATVHLPRYKD
ncbi:MAG TPA: ATP-binding protein [Candidatus Saccharimonadales bacterium]|nr:ATP-binding protein [Candidatus Saccharimonadales bacterium]